MALEIRQCQPDHWDDVREFFARVYRPDYVLAANDELMRWQFTGPAESSPNSNIKLAMVNGRVAGCLGYIPADFSVDGKRLQGVWTANWMVDPKYRSLGLGPLLMRELTAEFDLTAVVGISSDARALLPRMGFVDIGDLTRYVRVLDTAETATLTEPATLEWPCNPLSSFKQSSEVTRVGRFPADAGSLWDRVWGRDAGTRRSRQYLDWRYAEHPVFAYRAFTVRRDGQLEGIAVYRIEQVRDREIRVGRLVELIGESRNLKGLIDAVVADATEEDVALLDFFCASRRMGTELQRHGFLTGDEAPIASIPVLFQPVARGRTVIPLMVFPNRVAEALEKHRWYVTKSDGDQDRPN